MPEGELDLGRGLYAGVVGESWRALPSPIRAVHGPGRASGAFEVRRGTSSIARALCALCALPCPGSNVPVRLVVEEITGGLLWRRTIGETQLVTHQWARDAVLRERFGMVECCFRLEAIDDQLMFHPEGAALVLGPIRVPLPRVLAPRIRAVARVAERGVKVDVELSLPFVGLLLRYGGVVYPASD
jgi:hypothetical protein